MLEVGGQGGKFRPKNEQITVSEKGDLKARKRHCEAGHGTTLATNSVVLGILSRDAHLVIGPGGVALHVVGEGRVRGEGAEQEREQRDAQELFRGHVVDHSQKRNNRHCRNTMNHA